MRHIAERFGEGCEPPMRVPCKFLLRWCIGICAVMSVLLGSAVTVEAQDTFIFQWRVIGRVTRSTEGSDQASTTNHQMNGTGTLTLVRDPSPDVRFGLDFAGPDGAGSGLVPRVAEEALDPNFAFPNPLPPGLPPAELRSVRGSFRRLVDGVIPPAFEIVYSETFVCRASPEACGNVSSWEVLFIGNARRSTQGPPR
jgi:hypothetical protein